MTPSALLDHFGTLIAGLESAPLDAASLRSVSDDDLIALTELGASARRQLDARTALIAGELARRSRPELAHAGLAQRLGHRTADELVRVTTGESRRDASTAVNVGLLLAACDERATDSHDEVDVELAAKSTHLAPAIAAVRAGTLSPAALDAVRSGLGEPGHCVTAESLRSACEALVASPETLDVDRLYRRAREVRVELDSTAVTDRERRQRDARSLKLTVLPDGMTRATWLLDPESAAHVRELVDRATSPLRRTVTFVDPGDVEKAARIAADPRTPEQYASDALLHLLRAGAEADSSMMLGSGAPSVRVLVTARDLVRGEGSATLEASTGQPEGTVVSLTTVQRLLCAGTQTPIMLASTGQPLDVGRSQRLFTARQRVALAARDGGCRWPGCERPPSWCEAHHIDEWQRDSGRTDVEAGILLCRHHHLLLHDHGWRIMRAGDAGYELIPPATVDPDRLPRPMPSRSREWNRALAS